MRNVRVKQLRKQCIDICKKQNVEYTTGVFRFFKKLYINGLLKDLIDNNNIQ